MGVRAVVFAKKLLESCSLLYPLMEKFGKFKKSKVIHDLIIRLNDLEEDFDQLYLTSMRALSKNSTDVLVTIAWRNISASLEACADTCEHANECVGNVIMKNT